MVTITLRFAIAPGGLVTLLHKLIGTRIGDIANSNVMDAMGRNDREFEKSPPTYVRVSSFVRFVILSVDAYRSHKCAMGYTAGDSPHVRITYFVLHSSSVKPIHNEGWQGTRLRCVPCCSKGRDQHGASTEPIGH